RRLLSQNEFIAEFKRMINYSSETLESKFEYTDEEVMKVKMNVRWGPQYDLEQLLEHAVVHILRHRRQIEKFVAAGKISLINS
ncbi:MAG TPA: hypothetical protein VIY47_13730, partial [Ignavibacteriaceae bacterium]